MLNLLYSTGPEVFWILLLFKCVNFFCLFVGSCDFMIPLLSNHYPLKYLMCSNLFLLWLQATTSLQVPNISWKPETMNKNPVLAL